MLKNISAWLALLFLTLGALFTVAVHKDWLPGGETRYQRGQSVFLPLVTLAAPETASLPANDLPEGGLLAPLSNPSTGSRIVTYSSYYDCVQLNEWNLETNQGPASDWRLKHSIEIYLKLSEVVKVVAKGNCSGSSAVLWSLSPNGQAIAWVQLPSRASGEDFELEIHVADLEFSSERVTKNPRATSSNPPISSYPRALSYFTSDLIAVGGYEHQRAQGLGAVWDAKSKGWSSAYRLGSGFDEFLALPPRTEGGGNSTIITANSHAGQVTVSNQNWSLYQIPNMLTSDPGSNEATDASRASVRNLASQDSALSSHEGTTLGFTKRRSGRTSVAVLSKTNGRFRLVTRDKAALAQDVTVHQTLWLNQERLLSAGQFDGLTAFSYLADPATSPALQLPYTISTGEGPQRVRWMSLSGNRLAFGTSDGLGVMEIVLAKTSIPEDVKRDYLGIGIGSLAFLFTLSQALVNLRARQS